MSFRSLSRWHAALTLWLVAALLWAPIWGQWHGIAHQVQQVVSAPAASVSEHSASVAGDQDDGHPQGSALCQVLDHLGLASGLALGTAQARLVLPPLALPVLALAMGAGVRACWAHQARAPPRWI